MDRVLSVDDEFSRQGVKTEFSALLFLLPSTSPNFTHLFSLTHPSTLTKLTTMSNPAAATTSHGTGFAEVDSHAHSGSTEHQAPRFEEGTEGAHDLHDKTDQRSTKNVLAAAEAAEAEEKRKEAEPAPLPTAAAKAHGNEPSRGAKIDEQIFLEEQAELERKGRA